MINRDAKGIQAIRQGKWKYVDDYVPAANRRKVSQNKKMLFDLEKDPSETSNCIKAFPEVASELQKLLIQARQNSSTRKLHAGSLQ